MAHQLWLMTRIREEEEESSTGLNELRPSLYEECRTLTKASAPQSECHVSQFIPNL